MHRNSSRTAGNWFHRYESSSSIVRCRGGVVTLITPQSTPANGFHRWTTAIEWMVFASPLTSMVFQWFWRKRVMVTNGSKKSANRKKMWFVTKPGVNKLQTDQHSPCYTKYIPSYLETLLTTADKFTEPGSNFKHFLMLMVRLFPKHRNLLRDCYHCNI